MNVRKECRNTNLHIIIIITVDKIVSTVTVIVSYSCDLYAPCITDRMIIKAKP